VRANNIFIYIVVFILCAVVIYIAGVMFKACVDKGKDTHEFSERVLFKPNIS